MRKSIGNFQNMATKSELRVLLTKHIQIQKGIKFTKNLTPILSHLTGMPLECDRIISKCPTKSNGEG